MTNALPLKTGTEIMQMKIKVAAIQNKYNDTPDMHLTADMFLHGENNVDRRKITSTGHPELTIIENMENFTATWASVRRQCGSRLGHQIFEY